MIESGGASTAYDNLPTAGSGGKAGSTCELSNATPPADRGMKAPWVEQQAEDAISNARVLGPSRSKWDASRIEAEAVGRRAVSLEKTGDYVAFTVTQPANSIVVRFSIPDSPTGGGIDATLGVYVDGRRAESLKLTSRYSWSYQGSDVGDPMIDMAGPNPHTFFDEARLLLGDLPAGSEVKLQRDTQDQAAFYVIDLVDFEQVAPPAAMPAGFVSVTDFGALPDDDKDDANQILSALGAVTKLWLPPGRFLINQITSDHLALDNPGIEVRGAGMWHTLLEGRQATFFCVGADSSCSFRDFSIFGDTKARMAGPGIQKAFAGPLGNGSVIERVWIEHQLVGIWAGADPPYQKAPTRNLTVRDVRVRNVYAGGIVLSNGTSDALIESNHVRNAGDAAFAVWPIKWSDWQRELSYREGPKAIVAESRGQPDQGPSHGNTFRNLTAQMPWRGHCFGSYGGFDNHFENSVCEDVLAQAGILVANDFSSYPFGPAPSTFRNITLLRAGGTESVDVTGQPLEYGALELYLREGSISHVAFENVEVIDAAYAGVQFRGFGTAYKHDAEQVHPGVLADAERAVLSDVSLKNVTIDGACTFGVQLKDGAGRGSVSFEAVTVSRAVLGGRDTGQAQPGFFLLRSGNAGW